MDLFRDENINMEVLKERAYNMRWAEVDEGVIPLTAADCDFPASQAVTDAIIDYAKAGYFSYTPKTGFPEFKQSIARALERRKGEIVNPQLILPIDSAARGMSVIASAFLRPGDEAIVFDPVDYLFKTSMEAAGAKIILYPMKIKDGRIDFSDLESYITPKTKMLGLCNPHNPLGMLYPMEDLDHILSLSEKYGFYIMNDEIWSDIVYSGKKFTSILHLGAERNRRTISVFGFSKSFGMAGLRIGCVYCQDKDVFDRVVDASQVLTTIGGISSLSQVAGIACCDKGYDWVDRFVSHLESNRDYALDRIEAMPGITCHKPDATFVLFPDISATGMKAEELVELIKTKYKLALVPGGRQFFGPGSEGHIRICLATGRKVLEEGMNRLEKAMNDICAGK